MAGGENPTVRRRVLGTELRRLRGAAGLTIDDVAEALEFSASKVSRIETAKVGASPRDVRDMLELHGVTDEQRQEVLRVALRGLALDPVASNALLTELAMGP